MYQYYKKDITKCNNSSENEDTNQIKRYSCQSFKFNANEVNLMNKSLLCENK